MKQNLLKLLSILLVVCLTICFVYAEPDKKTVEGQGYYFNVGQSYPSNISIIGYNSRDDILYVNTELQTTTIVGPAETATFNYITEIYDDTGTLLGNYGTYDVPIAQVAPLGQDTVQITNMSVTLSLPLTSQNSVVITIKDVGIL